MCVYNSILAGRLGACWLAPGKAGWPLGRLLLLAALRGCWLAPGKAAGCAELLIFADFAGEPSLGDDADFSGYVVDMFHGKESI